MSRLMSRPMTSSKDDEQMISSIDQQQNRLKKQMIDELM